MTSYQPKFTLPLELGQAVADTSPGTDTFFNPLTQSPTDTRPVKDVLLAPHVMFYDPTTLHFPDAQGPVIRHNGGYASMGLGMVSYDHQPQWDRGCTYIAGPVRKFFRRILWDNRVKHL